MSYHKITIAEMGKVRCVVTCPNCGSRCFMRSSTSLTKTTRRQYPRCTDPRCGWSGIAITEVTGTIGMPHPSTITGPLPPLVDAEILQEPISDDQLI